MVVYILHSSELLVYDPRMENGHSDFFVERSRFAKTKVSPTSMCQGTLDGIVAVTPSSKTSQDILDVLNQIDAVTSNDTIPSQSSDGLPDYVESADEDRFEELANVSFQKKYKKLQKAFKQLAQQYDELREEHAELQGASMIF